MHFLIKIFRFAAGFALLAAIACSGDKGDKDVYETEGPYQANENIEKHDSSQMAPGTSTISADSLMKIIDRPQ